MPTTSGREFWAIFFRGPEVLEKQGRKIRGKKFTIKIRHQNSPAIFLTFAGPKQKVTPNPLCRASGAKGGRRKEFDHF